MPEITYPDAEAPIVKENGSMTEEHQRWTTQMTNLDLIVGSGSPEGVIAAIVGRQYMDDTGTTGSLLYMKKLADIGGDRTQGWVAV
jgi:hypothetical protein